MSTERDIIIERLEQKLAAKDSEFERMLESMRETIIEETEKKFAEKLKLRESTIDDIKTRFGDKINELLEMNRSLRDSIVEQQNTQSAPLREAEERISRLERRLVELNSAYEGVMKELLDQKSLIQELKPKKQARDVPIKPELSLKNEPVHDVRPMDKPRAEAKPREEVKDKPKPKGEYIIAENYVPKERKKQQVVLEAEEKMIESESVPENKEQFKTSIIKRSERVKEGVEIFEAPKRGR